MYRLLNPLIHNLRNKINYVVKDIAKHAWSAVTPDEAWAASDVDTCMTYCKNKRWIDGCCEEWQPNQASEECKITWSCE